MTRRHSGFTGHTSWTIEPDDESDAFELDISYRVEAYDPGRIFGPAEHCYPPEGGGVELLSIQRDGVDYDLSEAEQNKIILWLEENAEPPQSEYDE